MRDQDSGWQDAIVRRVCEKLYALVGGDLQRAYNRFDTNQDGYIGYDEFVGTLKSLDVGLSEQQIFELMQSVDVNDDAHIDFTEFVERFQVVFNAVGAAAGKGKRTSSITPDELQDGVEAAAVAAAVSAVENGDVSVLVVCCLLLGVVAFHFTSGMT
jgi:lysozyme family protein